MHIAFCELRKRKVNGVDHGDGGEKSKGTEFKGQKSSSETLLLNILKRKISLFCMFSMFSKIHSKISLRTNHNNF